MAYVNIAPSDYDPDSPITSILAGAWSNNLPEAFNGNAPFSGGRHVLLETVNVAAQNNITVNTGFDSRFSDYIITWDLKNSSDDWILNCRGYFNGAVVNGCVTPDLVPPAVTWIALNFGLGGTGLGGSSVENCTQGDITFYSASTNDRAKFAKVNSIGVVAGKFIYPLTSSDMLNHSAMWHMGSGNATDYPLGGVQIFSSLSSAPTVIAGSMTGTIRVYGIVKQ